MKIILYFLPVLLLFSCSVQKRKYQKGFYLSWNHANEKQLNPDKKKLSVQKNKTQFSTVQAVAEVPVSADASSSKKLTAFEKPQILAVRTQTCDEIIFKDGSEIRVKVVEISDNDVKYKRCEFDDGPLYTTKKTDIFMVKYANGTREIFKNEPPVEQQQQQQQSPTQSSKPAKPKYQTVHPMAILSLVFGILALIPFPYTTLPLAIAAVILGNSALREIRRSDEYKGEGLALTGKVLGIVVLSIIAIVLLIVILALLLFFL